MNNVMNNEVEEIEDSSLLEVEPQPTATYNLYSEVFILFEDLVNKKGMEKLI